MTASIQFDQPSFKEGEPIAFRVVVEGEPTRISRDVTVTGPVTLPSGTTETVSGTTQVVTDAVYGPFAADGYTVEQDPIDPARFTATPTAG